MTNQKNLVSVIMPAYNSERYIEDSINSVLSQTYENLELIIIDDGSKDNTLKIIERLSTQDKRINFVKNEMNIGVSETRNKGISLASGDWIAFLDSDDIWEKTKIEKQLKYANEFSAEFLFTGSSYINENSVPYSGVFEIPSLVSYKKLLRQNVITCSSVLLKKHFFKDIKMEKDEMHEDYAVWLRVLKTGAVAHGINEPLLIYRISKTSKSGNKLKTIKMTYKVFRFIGLNQVVSSYFTFSHIIGSVKKYRKVKKEHLLKSNI
ncbi:glycosyltransferase family 2 protein [Bacillus massilinigeriensis]|uniref:glycosyltransferase family 2 protein n=1 Tax=Bacillus massilionigeriensis TaxID=1805475 RepID=UPI000A057D9D|nr:glycosyltransferase [Bacillus massilionigeriensis]